MLALIYQHHGSVMGTGSLKWLHGTSTTLAHVQGTVRLSAHFEIFCQHLDLRVCDQFVSSDLAPLKTAFKVIRILHFYRLSIDIHRLSIDIHRLSIDIHRLSIDIHRLSIDNSIYVIEILLSWPWPVKIRPIRLRRPRIVERFLGSLLMFHDVSVLPVSSLIDWVGILRDAWNILELSKYRIHQPGPNCSAGLPIASEKKSSARQSCRSWQTRNVGCLACGWIWPNLVARDGV